MCTRSASETTIAAGHSPILTNSSTAADRATDNALAETINGLYKTEVIRRRGPWRNIDAVEYATLDWVDWFNNKRLLESIGNIAPAELEKTYYEQLEGQSKAA